MGTAMFYPANYGYVPQTLSEDGDPVDVLVVTPFPAASGCGGALPRAGRAEDGRRIGHRRQSWWPCRWKNSARCTRTCKSWKTCRNCCAPQISHFFEHYKDPGKGKWVKVQAGDGIDAAKQELLDGVARYK